MRTFFPASFLILALVVGAAGFAPAAHAQSQTNGTPCDYTDAGTQDGTWQNGHCISNGTYGDPSATKTKSDYKPDSTDAAYNSIMIKVMSLFAWLVGVAAITLDYAVYYTVVKMGGYVNSLSAIGVTWRVLRDIGNILLIFGFLAVGITTILNVDWYGGGKKMLPMMIVAAVFLNFSLFISEAIVDTGNLFATQFYMQINGGNPAGVKGFDAGSISTSGEGISDKIMSQLGMQAIYGEARNPNTKIFEGANPWLIGFMGIILFLVTAFVMFSLAFVLIARFVALVFLLVVAPIGFAGLAVPGFAARAKQWWTTLFEQTITAPILLLMLYIALAVITDAQFLTGFGIAGSGASASNAAAGVWTGFVDNANLPGFASVLLSFLVAIGLLLGVIVYAKRWSAFGGDWASRMGSRLSFGAASLGMRATLGMAGVGLASKHSQRWVNKLDKASIERGGGLGLIGRGLALGGKVVVLGGKGLRSAKYDVRNTGALQSVPLVGSNVDFGEGATITAKQVHEAQYGMKPVKEWFRESAKERDKATTELDRKDLLNDPGSSPADIKKELKKMSTDEIAELKGIRGGLTHLVEVLSPATYSELQKSDKMTANEKDRLKATWNAQFSSSAKARATIARLNTDEIASLSGDTITTKDSAGNYTVLPALGATELEAVRRKGTLDKAQRKAIYDEMSSVANPRRAMEFATYLSLDPRGDREKYWKV